ncbi:hypothetical protein Naga_102368g1, partial [Nannochloropsis gaditana]
ALALLISFPYLLRPKGGKKEEREEEGKEETKGEEEEKEERRRRRRMRMRMRRMRRMRRRRRRRFRKGGAVPVAGRRLSKEGRRKRGRDGTTGKRRMGWEKERQSSQSREERVENVERTRQGRPPQLRISSDLREKNRDPFLPSSVYFRGLKGGRRGGGWAGGRERSERKGKEWEVRASVPVPGLILLFAHFFPSKSGVSEEDGRAKKLRRPLLLSSPYPSFWS